MSMDRIAWPGQDHCRQFDGVTARFSDGFATVDQMTEHSLCIRFERGGETLSVWMSAKGPLHFAVAGASADADRAGGLRPEPVAPSQPKALIPCAEGRLRAALSEIEAFGYAHSGHGFSCARMASLALGNPVREAGKWATFNPVDEDFPEEGCDGEA